jgi:Domain of unknown function (DUF4338)
VYRYCGKEWTREELGKIRDLLRREANASRMRLSRLVCESFEWRGPNGKLKEMSCRVAMLKMHRDGLIELPAARRERPGSYQLMRTQDSEPEPEAVCSLSDLDELKMVIVRRGPALRRWNEFVGRHHYLSYKMLPGAQMRYFIMDGERVLGAMGFAAAAWKVAPRDNFIGWTAQERERGLHRIVGQSRFLILPWIRCRNLASKSLAMVIRRLPGDWQECYGFKPVLLETFVDTTRFHGTCYKASNWLHVGDTKGRGKLDRYSTFSEPVKSIWLRPLSPDFRQRLKEPAAS